MQLSLVRNELQVSDEGLHVEGGSCESLAGRLAANSAPDVAGSFWPGSAAAVTAATAQIAAANVRCTFRVQATATKLSAAATSYSNNEAASAAQLRAIATPAVG